MKEQMREEFEAWAKDCSSDFDFTTTPSGTYIDHITYGAWIGYRAGLAALSAVPAQEPVSEAVPWTYGANEFKDWCSHWFGVDADESYLSKAIHDLPPMAQNFKRSHSQQPVKQESWISVEERLPEVKAESCGFFLVTAINLQTQKKSVFEAAFLNEMELYSDGHDLQLFSGWHSAKESKDYDGWYEPLGNEYCKVTHWMVMPLPPTPE